MYSEGKLYIGFPNGRFLVVKPNDDGVEILSETELEGGILGSPVAWNGKVYIHTMSKLYVFGKANGEQPKATSPPLQPSWPIQRPWPSRLCPAISS